MPLGEEDDDLVARLKALRGALRSTPTGTTEPEVSSGQSSESSDDLANRFQKLSRHGVSDNVRTEHSPPSNLKSESAADEPDTQSDLVNFERLKAFLAEAKATLHKSIPEFPGETQPPEAEESDPTQDSSPNKSAAPEMKAEKAHDSDAEDDLLADDYIEKVLAELEFDMKTNLASNYEPQDLEEPGSEELPKSSTKSMTTRTELDAWTEADTINLPSAPLELVDVTADGSSGFPSVPSLKPSKKSGKSGNIFLQPNETEDVDNWCVICYDDATIQCNGCNGDLYCARCWKIGHMGESADPEERMHKWTAYKAPPKS